ncbi:MAG TPA: hypothetical protein VGL77_01055 [Armatimonadota bacterium]
MRPTRPKIEKGQFYAQIDNNLFRVTWHLIGGIAQGNGSAVYNRQKRTVKYWDYVQTPEYYDVEQCLVLDVDPAVFQQVIKEHVNKGTGTDGAFFDKLYQYGCRREGLRHIHHTW